jgi:hypothetical protein
MYTQVFLGLGILVGYFGIISIVLCAEMERRLRKVDRVIKQVEEDTKYVN